LDQSTASCFKLATEHHAHTQLQVGLQIQNFQSAQFFKKNPKADPKMIVMLFALNWVKECFGQNYNSLLLYCFLGKKLCTPSLHRLHFFQALCPIPHCIHQVSHAHCWKENMNLVFMVGKTLIAGQSTNTGPC